MAHTEGDRVTSTHMYSQLRDCKEKDKSIQKKCDRMRGTHPLETTEGDLSGHRKNLNATEKGHTEGK